MRCAARATVRNPRTTGRLGSGMLGLGLHSAPNRRCADRPDFKAASDYQAHCARLDPNYGPGREAIGTAGRGPESRAAAGLAGRPDAALSFCPGIACQLPQQPALARGGCASRRCLAADAAAAAARRDAPEPPTPAVMASALGALAACRKRCLAGRTAPHRRRNLQARCNMPARPPRARAAAGAMLGIRKRGRGAPPPGAAPARRAGRHEPGAAGRLARCAGGDRDAAP